MKIDKLINLEELKKEWEQGMIESILVFPSKSGWQIFAKTRKGAADDPRGFKIIEAKEGT